MSLYFGLTGGVATGKSTVAELFAELGCYTLDADGVSRIVMAPDGSAYPAVVERFGEGILADDRTIDRAKLREIVFDDQQARKDLEAIVHPAIHTYERKWVGEIRGKDDKAIIITHAALIIEAGTYTRFEGVMVVYVDPATQLQRFMARDGITEEQAKKVIAAQMPLSEKTKYAEFVIDNSGTLDDTLKEVARVYEALKLRQYTRRQANKVKP